MNTTPPVTREIEARLREIMCLHLQKSPSSAVWYYSDMAFAAVVEAYELGRASGDEVLRENMRALLAQVDGLPVKHPQQSAQREAARASLDRASGDGVRAQTIEECAKIADIYAAGKAGKIINRLDTRSISKQISIAIRALSAVSIPRGEVRLKIDAAPMIDGLRRLASHLHNLDSGSGEAKLIWAAADEIEMLQRPALPPAGGWRDTQRDQKTGEPVSGMALGQDPAPPASDKE